MDRFWSKVSKSDGCWEWTAYVTPEGYGRFKLDGRMVYAHRVAYELAVASIPPEMTLDHLCRNRRCVRPDHLEPVTRTTNVMRGAGVGVRNAAKTHCVHGHPLDAENTYICPNGARMCRACNRLSVARYHRRREQSV